MDRRAYLTTVGAGLSALPAGCLGGRSSSGITLDGVAAPGSTDDPIVVDPRDRVALVDFFATWCPPCKPEMEHLNTVRERYAPEQVSVVSVTQETDRAAIRRFWKRFDGSWPVAMDPELAAFSEYDVSGVPTIVVRAPDGTETLRHRGLAGTERLVAGVERALER